MKLKAMFSDLNSDVVISKLINTLQTFKKDTFKIYSLLKKRNHLKLQIRSN